MFERNGNFLLKEITLKAETTMTIPATIDTKPGGVPNSINPFNNVVTPVAVLTTGTLNAAIVDPATVRFGPAGALPSGFVRQDIDLDLVLRFRTQETGIACGMTSATLVGMTMGGVTILGTDSVRTVGCR